MGLFSFLTKKSADQSADPLLEQGATGESPNAVTTADADKLDAKLAKTRKRFTGGLLDFLTGQA